MARICSGDSAGRALETDDDDIILYDQRPAKMIIAMNANLDRALRLFRQSVDQAETLRLPGQEPFGPGFGLVARGRVDPLQTREGAVGQGYCLLHCLAHIGKGESFGLEGGVIGWRRQRFMHLGGAQAEPLHMRHIGREAFRRPFIILHRRHR